MMAAMTPGGPGDPHTQMNTYRSYVTMLADPGAKDEIKLKAAQELSENFEVTLFYKNNFYLDLIGYYVFPVFIFNYLPIIFNAHYRTCPAKLYLRD